MACQSKVTRPLYVCAAVRLMKTVLFQITLIPYQAVFVCIPQLAAIGLAEEVAAATDACLADLDSEIVEEVIEEKEPNSKIKADPFHLFNRFKNVRKNHGFHSQFHKTLWLCVFDFNQEDKANIMEVLSRKGVTWEQAVQYNFSWIAPRVRRYIPSANVLSKRLTIVFASAAKWTDHTTGKPFLNGVAKDVANTILAESKRGSNLIVALKDGSNLIQACAIGKVKQNIKAGLVKKPL